METLPETAPVRRNEDEWLWGWDPTPGIVSIWAEDDGRVTVWRRLPDSGELIREGDRFRVFLRFRRQKVITVVLNTEHDIHYFRDGSQRAHSRSTATHIAEVDNAGKSNEREKSRDDDNGFLWGMETWWRLQEKDGGVYVQSEIVSLTRDIPTGLGWMVGPFITSIPKDTLSFTLEATRKAVLAQIKQNAAAAR